MTISHTTAILMAADALESLGTALRALVGKSPESTGRKAEWPKRRAEVETDTPRAPEPEPEPTAEPDAPTLEQVRAVLANLSRKGATDEIRDILADLGCGKLSEVPAERYPEVLERAKSIQGSYR